MLDYIGWYLVELKMRLTPHFEAQKVYAILAETESHLKESASKIEMELNLPADRAAQIAVEAYGDPEKIALGYLREVPARFLGIRPVYWVLGGAILSILCSNLNWMWLWGYFDNSGATWQNYLAGLIGFSGLAAMFVGLALGKKSFRLPIFAVGSGMTVLLIPWLSFVMIGSDGNHHGISRFHFSRDVADLKQTVSKLDRIQSYFQSGRVAFATAKSAASLPPEFQSVNIATSDLGLSMNDLLASGVPVSRPQIKNSFPIPRRYGVFSEINGSVVALDCDFSFENAKMDWAENGQAAFNQALSQKRGMERLLASADEAQHGRLFFFNRDVYVDPVGWTMLLTGSFMMADGIVFAMVRRKRSWRRRILA